MSRVAILWALLLVALCVPAQPPAAVLPIRLKTPVSTQTSKLNDPVEAVVTGGAFAGAIVRGTVDALTLSTQPDARSSLRLNFTELETGGRKFPLSAQVATIDNAREKVDELGAIQGILASETITGRIDEGLDRLGEKYSGFADILSAVKSAVLKPATTEIAYPAGIEMTLRLKGSIHVPTANTAGPKPIAARAALAALIAREPFQTVAQRPPQPSDITNLLLIGSEDAVRHAFAEAGWAVAAALSPRAKFETLRALAEDRGYNEAPVSILTLDGKPPDFVFEKTNNTFARRHHLRLWLRPVAFQGKAVWAVAATHDIGISFSDTERTFIHRIDPQIDREREKVVDDLVFTGHVQGLELMARPRVPLHAQNATGDNLETDGRIAVLLLN